MSRRYVCYYVWRLLISEQFPSPLPPGKSLPKADDVKSCSERNSRIRLKMVQNSVRWKRVWNLEGNKSGSMRKRLYLLCLFVSEYFARSDRRRITSPFLSLSLLLSVRLIRSFHTNVERICLHMSWYSFNPCHDYFLLRTSQTLIHIAHVPP